MKPENQNQRELSWDKKKDFFKTCSKYFVFLKYHTSLQHGKRVRKNSSLCFLLCILVSTVCFFYTFFIVLFIKLLIKKRKKPLLNLFVLHSSTLTWIPLCIDRHKLNAIYIANVFPSCVEPQLFLISDSVLSFPLGFLSAHFLIRLTTSWQRVITIYMYMYIYNLLLLVQYNYFWLLGILSFYQMELLL